MIFVGLVYAVVGFLIFLAMAITPDFSIYSENEKKIIYDSKLHGKTWVDLVFSVFSGILWLPLFCFGLYALKREGKSFKDIMEEKYDE